MLMISLKLPTLLMKPTITPPIRLMKVVTIDMIESPLTNLVAPSMAPKKSASRWIFERRVRASCSSIRPELRSASIAICLPGIASRVNRAETSATRSEPLVMTRNWTKTMMRKMTRPTTTFPWMTNSPNVLTTSPA